MRKRRPPSPPQKITGKKTRNRGENIYQGTTRNHCSKYHCGHRRLVSPIRNERWHARAAAAAWQNFSPLKRKKTRTLTTLRPPALRGTAALPPLRQHRLLRAPCGDLLQPLEARQLPLSRATENTIKPINVVLCRGRRATHNMYIDGRCLPLQDQKSRLPMPGTWYEPRIWEGLTCQTDHDLL